jgi:hypothetical protein
MTQSGLHVLFGVTSEHLKVDDKEIKVWTEQVFHVVISGMYFTVFSFL